MDFSGDIKKLQDNFLFIRRAGGWSTRDFGDLIGVTNQTISNIENKKTELTKTQYLATLAALEFELSKRNPDDISHLVLGIVFGNKELSVDQRNEAIKFIDGIKKEKGLQSTKANDGLKKVIGGARIVAVSISIIGFILKRIK